MKVEKEQWANYSGREHSLIKHAVLKAYLQRFFMILGKRFTRIAYIDGFAGPWNSKSAERSDSSAGICLKAMDDCRKMLHSMYPSKARVRGLFIEQDRNRAAELDQLIARRGDEASPAEVWNDDFSTSVERIVQWLEPDEFAFVFVDPCGWKGLVEADVLAPLLRRPKTELLINFMWNFINLATGHEEQRANLLRVFGEGFEQALEGDGEAKQIELMKRYRQQLCAVCNGSGALPLRTSLLPVEYFYKRAIIFFLVYVTHNATGLLTFAEEAEKVERQQTDLHIRHRVMRREQLTGQNEMFADFKWVEPRAVDRALADLWLARIPDDGSELVVTGEVMASLIEVANCALSDLQAALQALIKSGCVRNLDAKRPRSTNAVNWRASERLVRLS